MSVHLKLSATAICIALLSVAIIACESEPTPTATPRPAATPAPKVVAPTAPPVPTAPPELPTSTPTPKPDPTATTVPPTDTPVPTLEPTATPVPPTETPTPEPTATPVPPTPTATSTPEPTPTVAPEPEAEAENALPFDPSVTVGKLSNGMTYYVRRNTEPLNRAQLSLVVNAGSVLEEEDERGLAHFVEHMAFNGTERFEKQQIIDYLESIGSTFGADLNAYTSFDETVYWLEIPTDDPEILETAFEILSDWAYAVSFTPEEVELERDVILEEWRLRQGFGSRFQENWFPPIFGESRYTERSPIGLTEVIETAPREDLVGFYERWYRPDLMAVVAVGDFDTELIEAKIKQHFAPPPEGEAMQERSAVSSSTTRPTFDVSEHNDPRINVFTDPESPVNQVILVRKLAPETGQDLPAFRRNVVEALAFMMLNARLFERGQAADPPYLGAGGQRGAFVTPVDLVQFWAWVEQDGIEIGFAALLEEMQRARQHGFTESELAREKVNLLSSIEKAYKERDQRKSEDLAGVYTDHFLNGTLTVGIEAEWELYQELLPQISLAEVDELADEWARTDNTVLLVMRPGEPDPISDDELSAEVQAQLQTSDSLEVEAYVDAFDDVPLMAQLPSPGSIVDEEALESIDAQKWVLSNGVTVIAKQTDFRNDEVVFTAFSPGGHSLVDDADHVSATYTAQIVGSSGVGAHDNISLEKLLAGKVVSVYPYISELFEGFGGNASPDDLETLFQLINLYATAPRLDENVYSRYFSSLQSTAETRDEQPDAVLFDTFDSVLSQNHFRRRPLTPELLDELSMERALAVYADRFADLGDSTFVFVGAFDWDELRSLTTTYLASLPTIGRVEQWRDVGIDPPTGLEDHTVRSGIEPRSISIVAFVGDMDWSRQESLTLRVAGEILQIRLREQLREALGGTYFVNVGAGGNPLPDPEYRVSIIYGSDPNRADELLQAVLEEVDWLQSGADQEDLDTVKELLRTPREEQLRENNFWLNQIETIMQRGESFTVINDFEEWLDAITLEQVTAAAQRYLTNDRYIRVVVLPEEN